MSVFLVWCNDQLLGIYRNEKDARLHVRCYMENHPGGDWYLVGGGRWAQKTGPVARLEVEEWRVM